MIKNWQSHQEYRHFLHEAKVHFDDSQRTRLTGEFAAAREKLRLLNLDPVMELLEPYYPPFGRPAVNQTQILRSPVLMLDQGFTSITAWVKKLSSDTLLAFLIGCSPDLLPLLGSYYDFIDLEAVNNFRILTTKELPAQSLGTFLHFISFFQIIIRLFFR